MRILKITYTPGAKSDPHSHPDAVVIPAGDFKGAIHGDRRQIGGTGPAERIGDVRAGGNSLVRKHRHRPGRCDPGRIQVEGAGHGDAPRYANGPGDEARWPRARRAVVYRATAEPTFQEPAGSKHEFDQVVISLSDAQMSLAIDGKPAKTKWTRGEVQFIPRGVAHESKNTGTKPTDFVIVAIK